MSTETAVTSNKPSCHGCHSHDDKKWYKNEKFLLAMEILEKISLVALAAFAAYTSPQLFFPFFGAGILLGVYLRWDMKKPKPVEEGEKPETKSVGCSQGFLEQLTGVRLPPPLGLAANIAVTVCHIDHHETVFVPLVGLNAGIWVGRLFGEYAPLAYRHAVTWIHQKRSPQAQTA